MTSGRIRIVCAPEALGLIAQEQSSFSALYPDATIELRAGSSRDAIAALFADECDLAVITRELEPEERRAAVQGGLEMEGYRFAQDAVVMVTQSGNPVENVAIDAVRGIYRGEVKRWSEVGGPNTEVVPVVQSHRSDMAAFFRQQVMGGEPVKAAVIEEQSDSTVLARVGSIPYSIGYVSMAGSSPRTKPLRLSSLTGLPYWKPDLEAVYRGEYPLTRYFNLYMRTSGPKLASGFITYVTSFEGQKLVREFGLVPAAVPVRFVRRSPMLSTHSRGEPSKTP